MISIFLKTRKDITDWSIGRALLQAQAENTPSLQPEHACPGTLWNRKNNVELDALDNAAPLWGVKRAPRESKPVGYNGFLWRRQKQTRFEGTVSFLEVYRLSGRYHTRLLFHSSWDKSADWYAIFRRWCELCEPYVGYAHHRDSGDSFDYGPIFDLDNPLPREKGPGVYSDLNIGYLPWCFYLGDEFAKLLDAPALRAEGFSVEDIGSGHLLRITDKPPKTEAQFRKFHEARERAIAHCDPSLRKRLRRKYGNRVLDYKDHWKLDVWEPYDPRFEPDTPPRQDVNAPRDWATKPLKAPSEDG